MVRGFNPSSGTSNPKYLFWLLRVMYESFVLSLQVEPEIVAALPENLPLKIYIGKILTRKDTALAKILPREKVVRNLGFISCPQPITF